MDVLLFEVAFLLIGVDWRVDPNMDFLKCGMGRKYFHYDIREHMEKIKLDRRFFNTFRQREKK